MEELMSDIKTLSTARSLLPRRQQPSTAFNGRATPKIIALYDSSLWDTDPQYPWSGSRVLVCGESAGDSSFARAEFQAFPKSLSTYTDAVAARLALLMRRSPLDLTTDQIDSFARREGSDPAMAHRALDGEGRYASISLPLDERSLAAFNSGTVFCVPKNELVETLALHLDLAEMFETGSWIWVSTLQGSATITVKTEVKKPGRKSEPATFSFTSSAGEIYAIHKSVKHAVDASLDRIAILSRPKTWKVA